MSPWLIIISKRHYDTKKSIDKRKYGCYTLNNLNMTGFQKFNECRDIIMKTAATLVLFLVTMLQFFLLSNKHDCNLQSGIHVIRIFFYLGDSRQNLMIYWLNDWLVVGILCGFFCCCWQFDWFIVYSSFDLIGWLLTQMSFYNFYYCKASKTH